MNAEERTYKDFIDYEPELIRYIDQDEIKFLDKYSKIIRALHEKSMTVKEIHDLYVDPETNKHTCTLKTIYRYLKRLEDEGFVTIAGYRMREGSRQTEKIYSQTARILLAKKDKEYVSKKSSFRESLAKNISILLKEVFNKTDKESALFKKIMLELLEKNHMYTDQIFDSLLKNKSLADLYANTNLDEIELVNIYGMFLITLLKNPELFNEIKTLFI